MSELDNNEAKSTFETLEVWKAGRRPRKQIPEAVKDLPAIEQYRSVDQIVRPSISVTANITEGYGRYYYQENIQYCRQARGSLFELLDHLYVALDEQYILLNLFNDFKAETFRVIKILNGYINHLKKQKTIC
ncbi:MAG: four helix bundle protein [Proteobacteria bacterium]|nr:four helix bundle protein [Pseudomonadota bacterium]